MAGPAPAEAKVVARAPRTVSPRRKTRARAVLDRHLRINSVLVEDIHTIGAQALQHALDGQLDMIRATDEHPVPLPN
jgi:hypothetical protein